MIIIVYMSRQVIGRGMGTIVTLLDEGNRWKCLVFSQHFNYEFYEKGPVYSCGLYLAAVIMSFIS